VVVTFINYSSQNIMFLRKRLALKVNRPILEVGFQPFHEILHGLLRK
jgi:hypothetical protein